MIGRQPLNLLPMDLRIDGTLKNWNDGKGFGFIAPVNGCLTITFFALLLYAFPDTAIWRPAMMKAG